MKYLIAFVAIFCIPRMIFDPPDTQRAYFVGECIMWGFVGLIDAVDRLNPSKKG